MQLNYIQKQTRLMGTTCNQIGINTIPCKQVQTFQVFPNIAMQPYQCKSSTSTYHAQKPSNHHHAKQTNKAWQIHPHPHPQPPTNKLIPFHFKLTIHIQQVTRNKKQSKIYNSFIRKWKLCQSTHYCKINKNTNNKIETSSIKLWNGHSTMQPKAQQQISWRYF